MLVDFSKRSTWRGGEGREREEKRGGGGSGREERERATESSTTMFLTDIVSVTLKQTPSRVNTRRWLNQAWLKPEAPPKLKPAYAHAVVL